MLDSCSEHNTRKEQIKNNDEPSTTEKSEPALNRPALGLPQKAATAKADLTVTR
jgi:hypothetical protein